MNILLNTVLFLLLSCTFSLAQQTPLTTVLPSAAFPKYIGVDIPATRAFPNELKVEYTNRFIYLTKTNTSSLNEEVVYQVDLYFGYISVKTLRQGKVIRFTQFYVNNSSWQDALEDIQKGITECLKRIPKASSDYTNVSLIKKFLSALKSPVDYGIGLVYGSTVGWLMSFNDMQYYYSSGNKVVRFSKQEGYSSYSSGGTQYLWGKMWKIELDMSKAVVNLYYNDYTVDPYISGSAVELPQKTVSSNDMGWKQLLLQIRLIEQNGGLNVSGFQDADKYQISSSVENFITSQLNK